MKNIIKILILILVSCQFSMAQVVTKTASKTNVNIGEEFFYTIRVEGFDNLNQLDKIEDEFGPEIDYLGIDLSTMQLFQNPLFCVSLTDSFINNPLNTLNNIFTLDFTNCNGTAVGALNSFSFKIKVKLNENACNQGTYNNQASLLLNNGNIVNSNVSTVNILEGDPFNLQKAFRNYDSGSKILTYDIRLSSETNNFDFLDFNANPTFSDNFSIPDCYQISSVLPSNHEVVYVPNENDLSITIPTNYSVNLVGNSNLVFNWALDQNFSNNTSILFQVKIKFESCSCTTSFFELNNIAKFTGQDICGKTIDKVAEAIVPRVGCNNPNTGGSGNPNGTGGPYIPSAIRDSIRVFKNVKLDGNDLNLTMKGCTGKYTITVENSSGRLTYNNFSLSDVLPQELDISGSIVINGNATETTNNNTVTVVSAGVMNPSDVVTIEIPFKVNTPLENFIIENCAEITVDGVDDFISNPSPFTLNREFCSPTVVTVPNSVAIYTNKIICKKPERNCGLQTIYSNLPGDEVEYTLHFYNYGTVEATNINVTDFLPTHFKIQNINTDVNIYTKSSGIREDVCGDLRSFREITPSVNKSYDSTTNKLELRFDPRHELDAFTCEGVRNYVVTVKVKIDNSAPNGTYDNQFLVTYDDPSLNITDFAASNFVSSTVNVDNLIIGNKSYTVTDEDCLSKKNKTVTYRIVLANMGTMPVLIDIEDQLTIPSPVSITNSGIFDIKICSTVGTNACTPVTTPGIPFSSTSTGFNINGWRLEPCSLIIIEYKATFNTNLISRGQQVEVCNTAKVRAYMPGSNNGIAVLTSNDAMIANYMDAKTDKEKLEAIKLIKAVKQNPKLLDDPNPKKSLKENENRKSLNHDFGKETLGSACITLTDCLGGVSSGCFTDSSARFNFGITSMNSNGEITTSLTNNSNQNITKIEYILTDIRQVQYCRPRPGFWGRRDCINNCDPSVIGDFTTTDTQPINGGLNYAPVFSFTNGNRAINKVEFSGNPTTLVHDNRTFNFPVSLNCNSTFEFTITAIVHFEDCSVCYATDVYDFNARYKWDIFNPVINVGTAGPIRSFN